MTIECWIDKWAAQCPGKTAILYEGQAITYGEFQQNILETAALLHHGLDVKHGDRVAYLGQNHPRMLYLLFACARLGAIFVPLNWRLTPAEHRHMLQTCGAKVLFVEDDYQDHGAALKPDLPDCTFVDRASRDRLQAEADTEASGELDDPLLIIFTSGTTGFPKGAVLTQQALETNALNSIHMHDMTLKDVALTILPMFHVGGMNIQTTAILRTGATVLLHKAFDPADTIRAINEDHPTMGIILPAHMPALKQEQDWENVDFSSLKSMTTGSCVIPDDMTAFWHGRKVPLLQVYGSSETCPIAIHQRAANAFDTEGSIGFPAQHCQVRIIDEAGQDCAVGDAGEILIKGQNIMAFYWQDKAATDKALKDGWFHTGDIGYRDEKGCYFFVDRKKDMIISGGENIYPAEIETVLANHPAIQEAAVVGRPDARWGETVVAFIVTEDGCSLNEEAIRDWLSDRLGRYKHPRVLHFIDQMPRNEMRKILKDDLRAMA